MQNTHIESEPLPYEDVTGVILAGGRSSRMGRDKAGMEIGGISFFDKILAAFQDCFQQVLVAGDRPDLARPNLSYVPDRYPGSAMGGLYTGLAEAGTPFIFVAPCDMPYPSPELIRAILDQRHGFDVVVPRTPDGLEPLFAVYGKKCLETMQRMLERKHYRIYDIYPQVRTRKLPFTELPAGWARSLCNVNTPEDYEKIKEEP